MRSPVIPRTVFGHGAHLDKPRESSVGGGPQGGWAVPGIWRTPGSAPGARITKQPQGSFLLEGKCPRSPQPAGALAQVGYRRPHRRLGQHPQPECERRRSDIEPSLERERRRDRVHVAFGELPVTPVPGLDVR